MNCPVTCGRPTRMSAEAFARMCAARRDYGNGMCVACGGRPENWPDELITIEGGEEMGKTIKEQIAEALAPVKKQLDEAEARAERLSDEGCDVWAILEGKDEGTLPKLAEKRMTEIKELEQRIKKLEVLEDQAVRDQECIKELEAALNDARAWAAELKDELNARNTELAAAKAAAAPQPDIDLSAVIYRDALADFAIRVLSGGVAVSFRGPTA